jgi:hypothetical protein
MAEINMPNLKEGKNIEETIKNLYDAFFKLRKELDFTLQHLDEANVTRSEEANRLTAPVLIELDGDVTGSASFDGSADAKITTTSAHKAKHENGGADEISVAGLSGELADAQTPKTHKTSHENNGTDEISVEGLSGKLADAQDPLSHKTSHENGGADEINVGGLSGELADEQKPKAHTHDFKLPTGGTANQLLSKINSTDFNAQWVTLRTLYKLSSAASSSITTLADISDWTIPVVSGNTYRIEVIAMYQTAALTTGVKLAIYARDSAVGSIIGMMEGGLSAASVATELKTPITVCAASNAAGSFLLTTAVSTINTPHYIGGTMIFTCTTSGNIRFQMASEVASSAAQINANSVVIVDDIK